MKKLFSFLGSFASAKAENAGDSIAGFIVRFDPETASEAQINEFENELNDLVSRTAQFRADFTRENAESGAIQGKYDDLVAAGEHLQKTLDAETDPSRKASLEASLGNLLSQLEEMVPEVEREREEAETAREFLTEFEKASEEAAAKLTSAKKQLERARKDMASAELQRERAERQSENAAALAGLRSKKDSMGVALGAMQEAVAEDRQAADALKHKAALLTKHAPKELAADANIAAALAEAKGEAKPAITLTARLAALKNKTTAPTAV